MNQLTLLSVLSCSDIWWSRTATFVQASVREGGRLIGSKHKCRAASIINSLYQHEEGKKNGKPYSTLFRHLLSN